MTQYTIHAERDGDWWSLQAAELPQAISQVKKLADAEQIREAISWITGEDESDIRLVVVPRVSARVDELVESFHAAALAAEEWERKRAALQHEAAVALVELKVSYRDVGELIGVSHQRVGQLVR